MITTLGKVLPFATAIALSPLPIIVAVFILVSDQAKAKSIGYLLGRIAAFTLVMGLVVFGVGASYAEHHHKPEHPPTTTSVIRVIVGLALFGLAAWYWSKRPRPGVEHQPSKLLQHVDRVSPGKTFILGILLVVLDVSTLILGAMAGIDIGQANLSTAEALGVTVIFLAIALLSCIVPIGLYLAAGHRIDKTLAAAKVWLVSNEKVVMMVMFMCFGAWVFGRGISDLTA